jgi:hypothetical protein
MSRIELVGSKFKTPERSHLARYFALVGSEDVPPCPTEIIRTESAGPDNFEISQVEVVEMHPRTPLRNTLYSTALVAVFQVTIVLVIEVGEYVAPVAEPGITTGRWATVVVVVVVVVVVAGVVAGVVAAGEKLNEMLYTH